MKKVSGAAAAALALAAGIAASQGWAQPAAQKPASAATLAVLAQPTPMNPDDRRDFEFARRGWMGSAAEPLIKDARGGVTWNLKAYDWAMGPRPETIHPSLYRNLQLLTLNGLFKVADGVYQVRGFDIANITILTGETGYVVIDPLLTTETAHAAMELVYAKLGRRPVRAVIYTHSHGDHYGGVMGVVSEAEVKAGKVAIIAPDQFMQASISETVMAGDAMRRRAAASGGHALDRGPRGTAGAGLGLTASRGTRTLIPPTDIITRTGERRMIDGITLEFQMVQESEAPSEFNIFLPDRRALLVAEMTSCSLHNIQTPRGARPRDALRWSGYLTEALRLYASHTEVVLMSHCWPRFGQAEVTEFLTKQRDTYKYIHDQTVRLMNLGYTPGEIAEEITLPRPLASEWYDRGNYGSVKFNAKAVYNWYLGAFDAVPANLDPLPPVESARRYVELAGGSEKMRAAGDAASARGEYRWAAQILQQLVFAEPGDPKARASLAAAYEQLGYQSESSAWRNIYLTGAKELRASGKPASPPPDSPLSSMPTGMYLDWLATRLDPQRIGDRQFSIALRITDRPQPATITVSNRVIVGEVGAPAARPVATLALAWDGLVRLFSNGEPLDELERTGVVRIDGDRMAVEALRSSLGPAASGFNIVTP